MGILSFLFTIFFFLIILGLVAAVRIMHGIFGIHGTGRFDQGNSGKEKNGDHIDYTQNNKKKIYDQNDGEYVDYEEMKDKK